MSSRTSGSHTQRARYDWVTASLLISLSPIALVFGLLFAMSDTISRVVGHRGKLLPRSKMNGRRLSSAHKSDHSDPGFKTVIITGASPIALALARELTLAHHKVILVDCEALWRSNRARYSRAVAEFIPYDRYDRSRLGRRVGEEKQYPQQILYLVKSRQADVWLPCDVWSTDEEKMQAAGVVKLHRPDCLVPFPGPESLDLAWNKFAFSKYVKSLDAGINTPVSTIVRSRGQIHGLLGHKDSKRRLSLTGPLSPKIHEDDATQERPWRDSGYVENISPPESPLAKQNPKEDVTPTRHRLPLKSLDSTYDLLTGLPISPIAPWDATEIIHGKPCIVYALIENGALRVFTGVVLRDAVDFPPAQEVASTQHGLRDEALSALSPGSPLYSTLLDFTNSFASKLPAQSLVNLTLKFILVSKQSSAGVEVRPWAVDCEYELSNTLLAIPGAVTIWTNTITRVYQKTPPKHAVTTATTAARQYNSGTYAAPLSLLYDVLIPFIQLLNSKSNVREVYSSWLVFVDKVLHWREELWSTADPAPFLWFWFIEAPITTAFRFIWNIFIALELVSPDDP